MACAGERAVRTVESSLTTRDGHILYTKSWEAPPGEAKAGLAWLHGFSDHCNNYDDFCRSLASHGITVFAYDQRGWGRSARCPVHVGQTGPTQTVLSDMTDFINSLPPMGDLPLFLGGHSMGGAACLVWASQCAHGTNKRIRGYVLESPYLVLHPSLDPSPGVVWLVRGLAWCLPNLRVRNEQRPELISRSTKAIERYRRDPLNYERVTLECIAETYARGRQVAGGSDDLVEAADGRAVGLWIGHGDRDYIVSYEATRAYFERSGIRDKTFETYESCYHSLHLELDQARARFTSDVIAWIRERAAVEEVQ
ncbi:hypothetical protein HIM_06128 [Hirsutella minnesotensis 3608]|uniref:Serine aminopeptidase S33 domain-containing protein n=1 Tax=Hirsutella minnesotensis 3608 TaxID=1043627 RepID=A0A0F7ZZN5_9HYPO|nr:hypothetical protein HIM_06128 [Hirsutella minnesotensis 3608]